METRSASSSVITDMLETYGRIVRLQGRLRILRRRLRETRDYLQTAGSNRLLGQSQYDRLCAQCSETLAGLRDAWSDSQRLIGSS